MRKNKPNNKNPDEQKKPRPQNLLRQKRLAILLAEDGGKTPIGKLMLRAGYKKSYARSPDKIKKTVTWQDLMEKNLPDNLLTRKHYELLSAVAIDHYTFPNAISNKEIQEIIDNAPGCKLITVKRNAQWARAYFSIPDNRSRKDAIDMAYKLKNKYPATKLQHEGEITIETVEIIDPTKKRNE